jgi:hypothetical protein
VAGEGFVIGKRRGSAGVYGVQGAVPVDLQEQWAFSHFLNDSFKDLSHNELPWSFQIFVGL